MRRRMGGAAVGGGTVGEHELVDGEPIFQLADALFQRSHGRFQIHRSSPFERLIRIVGRASLPAIDARTLLQLSLLEKSADLCNNGLSNNRGGRPMQYNFVSGDDHMDLSYIPARMWVERVPAKYRELAPRIEEVEGKRRWLC